MKYLYEEVAYLKGLAEGLEISKETKEGKIIHKIIDVLESFADSIVELDEEQCDLAEYVESIDEDLSDIVSYITNAFTNKQKYIEANKIKELRTQKSISGMEFTELELNKMFLETKK